MSIIKTTQEGITMDDNKALLDAIRAIVREEVTAETTSRLIYLQ